MCTPEGFHYFINHVKQRLIIILDHNIPNGIDHCELDTILLRELYDIYDKGAVDTFSDTEVTIQPEQLFLYGQNDMDHDRHGLCPEGKQKQL